MTTDLETVGDLRKLLVPIPDGLVLRVHSGWTFKLEGQVTLDDPGVAILFLDTGDGVGMVNTDAVEQMTSELRRLRAENERLREALDAVTNLLLDICPYFTGDDERRSKAFDIIRAALSADTDAGADCLGPEGTCFDSHVAPCPLAALTRPTQEQNDDR